MTTNANANTAAADCLLGYTTPDQAAVAALDASFPEISTPRTLPSGARISFSAGTDVIRCANGASRIVTVTDSVTVDATLCGGDYVYSLGGDAITYRVDARDVIIH